MNFAHKYFIFLLFADLSVTLNCFELEEKYFDLLTYFVDTRVELNSDEECKPICERRIMKLFHNWHVIRYIPHEAVWGPDGSVIGIKRAACECMARAFMGANENHVKSYHIGYNGTDMKPDPCHCPHTPVIQGIKRH